MLTATYTLVSLSVEQASIRVSLLSFQQYMHAQLRHQRELSLSHLNYAGEWLNRLYQVGYWRKVDQYLVPAIRQATRTVLEGAGYRTAVAAHGGEAITYLERFPGKADLVLTDVTMPVLDGVSAASVIAERYPELPVLFMSGLATETGNLAKPFSSVDLLAAVAAKLAPSAP